MIKKLFFIIILFTLLEGFGLRSAGWGGLGSDFIGWFGGLQIVVLISIFLSVVFTLLNRNQFSINGVNQSMNSILLLILFILFQTILASFWNNKINMTSIFVNLISLKVILVYFLFVLLLKDFKDVDDVMSLVTSLSVFCAGAAIFIVVFQLKNTMINFSRSDLVGREFRVINPAALLIALGLFYELQRQLQRVTLYGLFLRLPILFIGVAMQMHRNVLFGLAVVLIIFLFRDVLRSRGFFTSIFVFCVFILLFYSILNFINLDVNNLIDNYLNTRSEIENLDGNAGHRAVLFLKTLDYVFENYLFFGVGLNWDRAMDFDNYLDKGFIAGPTFDSGYANVLIVFGLLGFIVFMILFVSCFRYTIMMSNYSSPKNKIFTKSVMLFMVYTIIISSSSDTFLIYNSSIVFYFVISLIRLDENEFKESL